MEKEVEKGTLRIKTNLKVYEKKGSWVLSKKKFPEAIQAIKLFKANKKLNELVDKKDSRFFKGQLSNSGTPQGARINILPTGEKLEKAFSLFSPNLKIHDQDSADHWDVIYQNKGGTYSYVYTLDKRKNHMDRKYKKVEEFAKVYPKLKENVSKDLKDPLALSIYTLLETHMRVGNESYFKLNGHKGLTTLNRKDVSIKGNTVVFNYVGKDGVPINIKKEFPSNYVSNLKKLIKNKGEFVFNKEGATLHENDFKKAFQKYCGKEFYPHIVRSHYATTELKNFLGKKKKVNQDELKQVYLSIAQGLGHKKFDKKSNKWKENYNVTIHSYIQPSLIEKANRLI
jgi:hypothetical protein